LHDPVPIRNIQIPGRRRYFFAQNRAIRKDLKACESGVAAPSSQKKGAQWCQKVSLSSRLDGRCRDWGLGSNGTVNRLKVPLTSSDRLKLRGWLQIRISGGLSSALLARRGRRLNRDPNGRVANHTPHVNECIGLKSSIENRVRGFLNTSRPQDLFTFPQPGSQLAIVALHNYLSQNVALQTSWIA
jgi:hypothetical protein